MNCKAFFRIFFVAIFCYSVFTVEAQVRVRKNASGFTRNPTIVFGGIRNSLPISAAVNSMLKASGWFDVRQGGAADYNLQGSYSNGKLAVTLTQNGSTVCSFSLYTGNANARNVGKSVVDALLKKLFKVKGICNTKIAFCVDLSPKVKNIYTCDIDGGNLQRVTRAQTMCVEPEWLAGGKSILYTRYNRASTDIIQSVPTAKKSRIVAAYRGMNIGASPSPNGKYMALILSRDGQVDLYIKSLSGRARLRLTRNRAPEASPCWSPSGTKVCYTSGSSGRPQLYVISASGGTPRHLPSLGSEAVTPSWSSDNQIVYSAKFGRNYTLALMDLNGKKPSKVIINAAGDWESPSWAPDNRHVVCYRTYRGRSTIYVVDTWTSKVRKLVSIKNNASMPAWSK